eukprot:Colp12_sorted_trinity150504_noHs@29127
MTSILTGASLSATLKKPGRSIPIGTLGSVLTFVAVYAVVILSDASAVLGWGLQENTIILKDINFSPTLWVICVLSAAWGTGYSALMCAAQVLQAIANDEIVPGVVRFAKLSGKYDLPYRAILISWVIAVLSLFFGDVNVIAPYLTNFILITFGTLNFACFALHASGTPNFRPVFKAHSWWLSLAGALMCVVTMFLVDSVTAGISIIIAVVCFAIAAIKPSPQATNWGKISQALVYRMVMAYLHRLDIRTSHVKYWRPQVLVLTTRPREYTPAMAFANDLHGTGLFIIAHVVVGESEVYEKAHQLKLDAMEMVDRQKVTAFVEINVSPNLHTGLQTLLLLSGVGAIKPNTVVTAMPILSDVPEAFLDDWFKAIQSARQLHKSVCITINPSAWLAMRQIMKDHKTSAFRLPIPRPTIDIWITGVELRGDYAEVADAMDAKMLVVLQLAFVFHSTKFWAKRTDLRVLVLSRSSDPEEQEAQRQALQNILVTCRITAQVKLVQFEDVPSTFHHHHTSSTDSTHSTHSTHSAQGTSSTNPNMSYDDYLHDPRYIQEKAKADFLAKSASGRYRMLNGLMRTHSKDASLIFMCPQPDPLDVQPEHSKIRAWCESMYTLIDGLPPAALILPSDEQVATTLD